MVDFLTAGLLGRHVGGVPMMTRSWSGFVSPSPLLKLESPKSKILAKSRAGTPSKSSPPETRSGLEIAVDHAPRVRGASPAQLARDRQGAGTSSRFTSPGYRQIDPSRYLQTR